MDSKLQMETTSLILLIIAFPIISIGATHGIVGLWIVGFGCVVAGGVIPVLTRFMDHSKDKPTDMGMEFDERTS